MLFAFYCHTSISFVMLYLFIFVRYFLSFLYIHIFTSAFYISLFKDCRLAIERSVSFKPFNQRTPLTVQLCPLVTHRFLKVKNLLKIEVSGCSIRGTIWWITLTLRSSIPVLLVGSIFNNSFSTSCYWLNKEALEMSSVKKSL